MTSFSNIARIMKSIPRNREEMNKVKKRPMSLDDAIDQLRKDDGFNKQIQRMMMNRLYGHGTMSFRPMNLYHATTPKKAKLYLETGFIQKPVRGFTTLEAAMCWSLSIEGKRTVFLEVNYKGDIPDSKIHKLPDHHNAFGEAWWIDDDVKCDNYRCVLSMMNGLR